MNRVLDYLAFNVPVLTVTLMHIALLLVGIPIFGAISLFTAAIFGGLVSNLVTLVSVLHSGRRYPH